MDQSDAGRAGIFSRRTNRTRDVRVYSHDGPIGRRTCARTLARPRVGWQRARTCGSSAIGARRPGPAPSPSPCPRALAAGPRSPDQSDAARTGIFSRRTNQTQEARVYSHDGPIGRRTRGYIPTTDI
eukprot:461021-Prorocentrum_minimum.AAC.1